MLLYGRSASQSKPDKISQVFDGEKRVLASGGIDGRLTAVRRQQPRLKRRLPLAPEV